MASEVPDRDALFCGAIEIASAQERAAFIAEACGGDAKLRRQVEQLVEAHFHAGSFLDESAPAPATGAYAPGPAGGRTGAAQAAGAPGPGTVIGPYKLLELIGEGGMGSVWLAQQSQPVRRRVALKLIKAGMDSSQVVARFEAERQALALMDHPHIAKVFDGGTTESGRPYFVMELVQGTPITAYCDEHRLTPRERLELMVPVCQAVQHAHQKGVIHRDVKPSNVLVAPYDGQPVVKVIDFGVAKAVGQPLTEKTLFTGLGAVVGTLEYMSPEQAQLNNHDVDTRSDVYSLGVLLYELLTGTTPLQRKRLREAALLEGLRLIREEEPPRPSTRLSESRDTLPSISARRQTEPRKLARLLRGELDWIVMRALEKDRARRYETANGLARDVQRYLADEPVEAGPPSAGYKLRKFARKYRRPLAMAAVVILAALLAVGSVAGSIGWVIRDRAERQAEVDRERAARQEKIVKALEQAEAFLRQEKWAQCGASADSAAVLLADAAESPALQQRLDRVRADRDMGVGLEQARLAGAALKDGGFDFASQAAALAAAFEAYDLPVLRLDPRHAAERVAASPIREALLAGLVCYGSNPSVGPSEEKKLTEVLRRVDSDPWRKQAFAALARNDWDGLLRLARQPAALRQPPACWHLLGDLVVRKNAPTAVALLRQAQQRHPDDFWINAYLGVYLLDWAQPRQPGEAIGFLRAAVALRPQSPGAHLNLGKAHSKKGRLDEAIAEYRQALHLKKDYAEAHFNLALVLEKKGRLTEAIAEYRQAIRAKKGFAEAHCMLGAVLGRKGQWDEAIAEYREAIRTRKDWPEVHNNLGNALSMKGRLDQAIAEYRQALRTRKDCAEIHGNLGNALLQKGRLDEGIAAFREAIRLKKDLPEAHSELGRALGLKGQLDEAIAAFREAIRLRKDFAEAHFNLGFALAQKGRPDEAIAEYREAIRLRKDYAEAHGNLGAMLAKKGQLDEAIAERREAVRLKKDDAKAHFALACALRAKQRLDEARTEFREAIRLKKDYAVAHYGLGRVLYQQNKFPEAAAAFREAVRIQPEDVFFNDWLGIALLRRNDVEGAIASFRTAVRLKPGYATGHINLGNALRSKGDLDGAIAAYRKALHAEPGHVEARERLALAYRDAGDFAKARPLLEPRLQAARGVYRQRLQRQGPGDINTLLALRDVAQILTWQGRFDEAEPLLWRVLAGLGGRRPEDPIVAYTKGLIAGAGRGAKRPATDDWLRAWHAERKQGGDGGGAVATALEHFGRQQLGQKKWDEAEPLLRDCLKAREAKRPDEWTTFHAQSLLGEALLGQKKHADAQALLVRGYEGMKRRAKAIPPQDKVRLTEALGRLVQLYDAWGKADEAARWRKELAAAKAAKKP